jgi:hypothetical protein
VGEHDGQALAGPQGAVTSQIEREAVLRQNELLRQHYSHVPGLFQKLRRCCICLQNSCVDLSACSSEFETWTKANWEHEVVMQAYEVERRQRLRHALRWSRMSPLRQT